MIRLLPLLFTLFLSAASAAPPSMPAVTLPDLSGQPRSLDEWAGRVVAVNFWATWCSPCVQEIPELVRLQRELGGRGLQWVGIAVEAEAQPVRDFAREIGMNYPTLIGEDSALEAARAFGNGVGALPFTAVIDRAGNVVFTRQGTVSYDEMVGIIEPLL